VSKRMLGSVLKTHIIAKGDEDGALAEKKIVKKPFWEGKPQFVHLRWSKAVGRRRAFCADKVKKSGDLGGPVLCR